jgi:cytochrome d ubiquinol oxidase subunit II
MSTEIALGGVILAALILYIVLGGADFGGGVWDLLASGPRRADQRRMIEHAIGPIWEANHVWLILVVVVLFTGFPPAFAAISTALHVPLTLFLVGVVFRGSAFAFRSQETVGDRRQRQWGYLFSLASVISPMLLGMVVGALASGDIRLRDGAPLAGESGYFAPWLAPFPLVVGGFTVALCAFLAATYLCVEADVQAGGQTGGGVHGPAGAAGGLLDDFRSRALASAAAVAFFAVAALLLSGEGAPRVRAGLTQRAWAWPLHLATLASAVAAVVAIARRRFRIARVLAAGEAALIVVGWAASQYPYLVVPDVTLAGAAASPRTRGLLLVILAGGIPVLAPSLYLLFRVFKSEGAAGLPADGAPSAAGGEQKI